MGRALFSVKSEKGRSRVRNFFNCESLFQKSFSERIGIASFMHAVSLHYVIFEMKVDMQTCLAIDNTLLRQCEKGSAYLIKLSGLKTVNTVVS